MRLFFPGFSLARSQVAAARHKPEWDRFFIHCASSLLIALGTFFLFLPCMHHGFLTYDDQEYVTGNVHVIAGLTPGDFRWAFHFHAANWHPITWLSHMLDCQTFGLNPGRHHLVNIVLHSLSAGLLFILLLSLTDSVTKSAAASVLFAWHPLRVESVAWIAERKDVLSALFFFLTLLAYVRYVRAERSPARVSTRKLWYCATLLIFSLALMSKPMVVTLPFVLLLLDFWPLRRINSLSNATKSDRIAPCGIDRSILIEKVPFLAMSAAVSVLTFAAQKREHAIVTTSGLPLGQRLAHASVAYLHYLTKTFFPSNLSVYYPYHPVPASRALGATALLLLISWQCFRVRRNCPYLITGWLWFIGMLIPVIGVVQVGDQAWADRYTYLPSIGITISIVCLANDQLKTRGRLVCAVWFLSICCITLALLTRNQISYWQDTETLFTHAAEVTPNNHVAISILGGILADRGRFDEAIRKYEEALSIKPGYPEAIFLLGNAFEANGHTADAIRCYQQTLWYKPVTFQAYNRLGVAYAKENDFEASAACYKRALAIDPESAQAHNNYGRLLQSRGDMRGAVLQYEASLRNDPRMEEAHNNLGAALLEEGLTNEGLAHLREALRLKENPQTACNLALALCRLSDWTNAADLFATNIQYISSDARAHCEYGVCLAHLGQTKAAESELASALLNRPDYPEALQWLAWILSTSNIDQLRNGVEAARLAERGNDLTGHGDPLQLRALAAGYAECGRYADAIEIARTAEARARGAQKNALALECQLMRERFASGRPWRSNL